MEYDKKPEKDWVEGLRAGDENAYRYLYQRHYKVLCAFAYSYVNDYFVAETLVSDVIFAIWNNREELRIIQSLRAYLMRAVKNSCINHLEYCARQEVLRDLYAVRKGNYKAHFSYKPAYGPGERIVYKIPVLYDLGSDPEELYNVADKHPDIVKELTEMADSCKNSFIVVESIFDKPAVGQ